MKKYVLMGLLFCLFTVHVFAETNLYPQHNQATHKEQKKTQRIHVVWGNKTDIESHLTHVFQLTGVEEDADVWIYPIIGSEPEMKLEATQESVTQAFDRYVPKQEEKPTPTPSAGEEEELDIHFESTVNKAVEELQAAEGYENKMLIIYLSDKEEYRFESLIEPEPEPAEGEEEPQATEPPTALELLIQREAQTMMMQQIIAGHPDIFFLIYDNTSSIQFENSFTGNFSRLSSGVGLMGYAMNENGYRELGASSYSYDRRTGLLTIKEGKANANVLVYAYAKEEMPLYISGCLASNSAVQAYQGQDEIKGVSLGYHHMNFSRTVSPRSIAMAKFTIDSSVADVQKESFRITVKNADGVVVYYTASAGSGVCSADASYDRSQDDRIVNRYASGETATEEYQFIVEENPDGNTAETEKQKMKYILIGVWILVALVGIGALIRNLVIKRR